MDMKNINLLGIIALVGAIILVVGVFLDWVTPDNSALKLLFGDKAFSGMDLFNNKNDISKSVSNYSGMSYTFVPVVALVCGIISLVLMIVPTIMNTEKFQNINNILGLVALVLSLVVVICSILFYLQTNTLGSGALSVSYKLSEVYTIGAGFWLVLVGGIITLVGGVMPIIKNKLL